MSEVDVILNKLSSREDAREGLNMSKNHTWKNEWEKAQAESRTSTDRQDSANINSKKELEVNLHQRSVFNENTTQPKRTHLDSAQSQLVSQGSTVTDVSERMHMVTTSKMNAQALMGANRNLATLLSMNPALNQYAIHLLEGAESRFRAQFKLQNISIIRANEGLKLVIRDYRMSKDELELVTSKMKNTLHELGLEIEKIVINGEEYI